MEIEKLDTRTLNNGTSMPIGKNFFRAKLKDRKQWIEGKKYLSGYPWQTAETLQ